jgi:hypothetical protein
MKEFKNLFNLLKISLMFLENIKKNMMVSFRDTGNTV